MASQAKALNHQIAVYRQMGEVRHYECTGSFPLVVISALGMERVQSALPLSPLSPRLEIPAAVQEQVRSGTVYPSCCQLFTPSSSAAAVSPPSPVAAGEEGRLGPETPPVETTVPPPPYSVRLINFRVPPPPYRPIRLSRPPRYHPVARRAAQGSLYPCRIPGCPGHPVPFGPGGHGCGSFGVRWR